MRAKRLEKTAYFFLEYYNERNHTHTHKLVEDGAEQTHLQQLRNEQPREYEHKYSQKDIERLRKFQQGKPVSEQEISNQLLFETQSYAEASICRRKLLLHYFGEEYKQDCFREKIAGP